MKVEVLLVLGGGKVEEWHNQSASELQCVYSKTCTQTDALIARSSAIYSLFLSLTSQSNLELSIFNRDIP